MMVARALHFLSNRQAVFQADQPTSFVKRGNGLSGVHPFEVHRPAA